MQQALSEAGGQLKELQQMRQKEIWQLLHHWSLKVYNAARFEDSGSHSKPRVGPLRLTLPC